MSTDGMPTVCDAYGEMIRDAYKSGEEIPHAHEWGDGNLTFSNTSYLFQGPDRWREVEKWGLTRMRGRVLDIGTGAGRLALALQAGGHDVTAVDASPGAVEVAASRGVRQVVLSDLANAWKYVPATTYGTIALFGHGLALLGTPERAPGLLRMLHGLTRPGARLIGEGENAPTGDSERHERLLAARRESGLWPGQEITRLRYLHLATEWQWQLYADPDELNRITEPNGWKVIGFAPADRGAYMAELLRVEY